MASHTILGQEQRGDYARVITFPAMWVDGERFEASLLAAGGAHEAPVSLPVVFRVAAGSRVMIDAAVRLLSLANQLVARGRTVCIDFADGLGGTAGYLNRIGFFEHLDARVLVKPDRPLRAALKGNNATLVEIEALPFRARRPDGQLPGRLRDALLHGCAARADSGLLGTTAFYLFSELISNVYDHSRTPMDGFAALQLYSGGNNVKVVVSDSGLGIINTLRAAVAAESPALSALTDTELVVEAFRNGLSQNRAPGHGNGLPSCAHHAMKFNATLDVRLDEKRVTLRPVGDSYQATATGFEKQPRLNGTHICFTFSIT